MSSLGREGQRALCSLGSLQGREQVHPGGLAEAAHPLQQLCTAGGKARSPLSVSTCRADENPRVLLLGPGPALR